MASFLSNPEVRYNAPVQTAPLEAMVKVGAMKQELYDQGVQKIQTQIDTVASLPVIRDVDKQYINESISNLQTELKKLNTADFSQMQVQNSVMGMATKISKDNFVRAAVESATHHQSQLEERKRLEKEGKTDKNNDDWYFNNYSKYATSTDLTTQEGDPIKFSTNYIPYTDIVKEMKDALTNAGEDSSLVEMMYEVTPDGKLRKDQNGNLIPARTMTQVKQSTNIKQVEAALQSVLSKGNVQQQLQIDGWANTRFTPVSSILKTFEASYKQKQDEIDEDLLTINTLLSGKIDDAKKQSLEQQRLGLNGLKQSYQNQYNGLKQLAETNPDQFKQNWYRTNFTNNLVSQYTKQSREEKNIQNPLREQLNWEMEFSEKINQNRFSNSMALKNLELKQLEFQASHVRDPRTGKWRKLSESELEAQQIPTQTTATVDGSVGLSPSARLENTINGLSQKNEVEGRQFMFDLMKRAKSNEGKTFTQAEFNASLDSWAKAAKETPLQYITRWIYDLDRKAKWDNISLDKGDVVRANSFIDTHKQYTNNLVLANYADQEAKTKTGFDVNEALKNIKPQTVKLKDKTFNLTKQDMFDIAVYMDLNTNSPFKTKEDVKKLEQARTKVQRIFGTGDKASTDGTLDFIKRTNDNFNISNIKLGKFKEAMVERDNIIANALYDEDRKSFTFEDDKSMKAAKSRVNSWVAGNDKISVRGDGDLQTALKYLAEDNSRISFVQNKPFETGQEYTGDVVITNKDGNKIVLEIPNQKDFEGLSNTKGMLTPFVASPLKQRLAISKFGSTNLGTYNDNPNAWKTAYMSGNDLPASFDNFQNYTVLGVDARSLYNGSFTPDVYVLERKTGAYKRLQFGANFTNEQNFKTLLSELTEAAIALEFNKKNNK